MFCSECKMAICAKCYIEGHTDHTCSNDINKICDEFREQLRKNTDTVSRCLSECLEIQREMEDRNRRVLADAKTCETGINKSRAALKEMIDKHEIELMTTLCEWRETEMTKIKESRLDIENHIAILESYSRYTKEVTDMGSTRDIFRTFQELNTRADELKKTYDSYFQHHRELFSFSGITFSKFDDDWIDGEGNLIGVIIGNGSIPDASGKDGSKTSNFKIKMEKLETELAAARKENAEHVRVITTIASENVELKISLKTSCSRESSLKNHLAQADQQILEVEKILTKAIEEKSNSEGNIAKLYELIDQHNKLVQKLTTERDAVTLKFQTVTDQHKEAILSLNKDLDDLQVDKKCTEEKLITTQKEILKLQKEFVSLKQHYTRGTDILNKEKEVACKRLGELEQERNEMVSTIQKQQAESDSLRLEILKMSGDMNACEAVTKKTQSKLMQEKSINNKLRQENGKLVDRIGLIEDENFKLLTMKSKADDELHELQKHSNDLRLQRDKLKVELRDKDIVSNDRVLVLQRQINSQNEEITKMTSELQTRAEEWPPNAIRFCVFLIILLVGIIGRYYKFY